MFDIIIDTREKQPWLFEAHKTISRKLDTGDYSICGLEDQLCIERKKSVAELANNLTDQRFKNELERMSKYKFSFLILEFDYRHIDSFPEGSGIPKRLKKKVRVKGPFIISCLSQIRIKYNIHIIPCSNAIYAEYVAYDIMKRVYQLSNDRNTTI